MRLWSFRRLKLRAAVLSLSSQCGRFFSFVWPTRKQALRDCRLEGAKFLRQAIQKLGHWYQKCHCAIILGKLNQHITEACTLVVSGLCVRIGIIHCLNPSIRLLPAGTSRPSPTPPQNLPCSICLSSFCTSAVCWFE